MLEKLQDKAKEMIGHLGKMVSGSKGTYSHDNPDNLVVFNANICTEKGKIWYGDIDITHEEKNLIKLSKATKTALYVLHESDARFENEKSPRIDRAVAKIDGDLVTFSPHYKDYVICEDGLRRYKPIMEHEGYKWSSKLEIPDIDTFYVANRKASPLALFHKWIEKNVKAPKGRLVNLMHLHITRDTEEEIQFLCYLWLKKVEKASEYQARKASNMACWDMPSSWLKAPDWAEPGYLYIEDHKDLFMDPKKDAH